MKVVVFGGGSFGTAMAHQLSYNENNEVYILLRDSKIKDEINQQHSNSKYFSGRTLHHKIQATTDSQVLNTAAVVLITLPTKAIPGVVKDLKKNVGKTSLIVNMAKGLYENGETIVEYLRRELPHQEVISWKGGSFSVGIINRSPSLLTLGYQHINQLNKILEIIEETNLLVDYTTDIKGVELLSALKNMYAIILGYIDAKYNSANTRFLVLTKAIAEIKIILKALGGKESTIFLSCGIGDISLTSLNDLSRNRTLGLLIGKGFYNTSLGLNFVVLEGVKTIEYIDNSIDEDMKMKLPLFKELVRFFTLDSEVKTLNFDFKKLFRRNYKTVLTYGTFDLIHFGHLEILRRAKAIGDRLIVGLSTDEFNAQKDKICEMPYEKRKEFLESIDYVDLVIPETNWEQKIDDVINHQVDIFVMGDDWKGKFDFLEKHCEVRYLPRTKGISTTAIKSIIRKQKG